MPQNDEEKEAVENAAWKFNKEYKKLKEQRQSYLKDVAKMYSRFLKASGEDINEIMQALLGKDPTYDFERWDRRCKPIFDSLVGITNSSTFVGEYKRMEQDFRSIKANMKDKPLTEEDRELILDGLKKIDEDNEARLPRLYYIMFNERM